MSSFAAGFRFVHRLRLLLIVCLASSAGQAFAAGKVDLKEDATDARVFQVTGSLQARGKVYTRAVNGTAEARNLVVDFPFSYLERRLTGIGREAQSLRTIRYYEKAKAQITVGEQITSAQLRDGLRLVVASGQREGISLYSPTGPFTFSELELLRIPGDSAGLSALLPLETVEAGDTWKPSDWVLQMLVGVEAVEKSQLVCKLESIEAGTAKINFAGEVTGADRGAAAGLKVTGTLLYDTTAKFIREFRMDVADKHSIGIVSPGLDVNAHVVIERKVSDRPARFSDQEIKQLPLEPQAIQQLLVFEVPEWGVRFFYDRQWHLFQHLRSLAVFRLLEKGQPVTQLNLHKLSNVPAGIETSLEQFEKDVQQAMGKTFRKVLQSEKVPTADNKVIYRVEVFGQVERPVAEKSEKGDKEGKATIEQVPYQWIHYLVSAPDGRRINFVFILEPKAAALLQGRDLSLVASLQFVEPRQPQLTPVGGE